MKGKQIQAKTYDFNKKNEWFGLNEKYNGSVIKGK